MHPKTRRGRAPPPRREELKDARYASRSIYRLSVTPPPSVADYHYDTLASRPTRCRLRADEAPSRDDHAECQPHYGAERHHAACRFTPMPKSLLKSITVRRPITPTRRATSVITFIRRLSTNITPHDHSATTTRQPPDHTNTPPLPRTPTDDAKHYELTRRCRCRYHAEMNAAIISDAAAAKHVPPRHAVSRRHYHRRMTNRAPRRALAATMIQPTSHLSSPTFIDHHATARLTCRPMTLRQHATPIVV